MVSFISCVQLYVTSATAVGPPSMPPLRYSWTQSFRSRSTLNPVWHVLHPRTFQGPIKCSTKRNCVPAFQGNHI
ncbi:uncharacterized protein K444DRAFT_427573 [Hyaloscypha bicolor E]|uniref:Secreted protein n=1 Tax=Hyaloscypha bicolor E TaxID=1095630 RepID=A0A2J6T8E2_9HELO|nr:uncharacterized protein K444DRAFT_427573 [Hyaloscypha bicolor E]PMD59223.1 hypothetical protein K444DRAFT_427573 [Hyaloscypha bicolor E]